MKGPGKGGGPVFCLLFKSKKSPNKKLRFCLFPFDTSYLSNSDFNWYGRVMKKSNYFKSKRKK